MEVVKSSILKALAATVIILMLGIVTGLQMDNARTQFLEDRLEETNLQTETFLVTQSYAEDSSRNYCRVVQEQIPSIAQKNAQIGRDLQSFSGKSISGKQDYKHIKKKYYVSQLKLYTMLQNYKNRCEDDINLVLFFFDSSTNSGRQGAVLTEYRRNVDNQTYVFSYNLETKESAVLDVLVADYEVEDGPTIVVNGDRTYRRYVPLDELKQVM